MKLYYTRTPHKSHEKQTILNCFLTYEEAVEQANQLLLITCFPCIEIIDMDTDKLFITLTRLPNATKDTKKIFPEETNEGRNNKNNERSGKKRVPRKSKVNTTL